MNKTLEEREKLRTKLLERIPSWYNPYLHLALPSLFGIIIIVFSLLLLREVHWWEFLTVPITYVFANGVEWFAHRNFLHKRNPVAPILYMRHTPEHHVVYITDDMALRDYQEMRLILIPAYAIPMVFVIVLPISFLLYKLISLNVSAFFTATSLAYVVGYEWLHLSYHLPANHPISRLKLIKKLKHHHAVHHDPKLMQKWNLNVTIPLWDWILRTNFHSSPPSASKDSRG